MEKDILFFSYSWVHNANFIFKKFESMGHKCDYVYENTIHDFKPLHNYKAIVLYLHEPNTIPITNTLIDTFYRYSYLIQHDDTDFEDVQVWSNKKPDIIMQRELTEKTRNRWNSPIFPFHFPIPSKYDEKRQEKKYDISFLASLTNERRIPFIKHVEKLANTSLSHLKWNLQITPRDVKTSNYNDIINQSKIGLHYFGNSYDSIRIWELASAKCSIIMPKLRLKSTSEDWMPFNEYLEIRDDFQDLEEKILYMLEDDRYKIYAENAYLAYNNYHNPDKCFEKYYETFIKHIKL
jgi:hypothetical protein